MFYWINPTHKAVILEAPLQFLALPIMKMNASKETKPNPKHEVGTKWFLKPFSVTSTFIYKSPLKNSNITKKLNVYLRNFGKCYKSSELYR